MTNGTATRRPRKDVHRPTALVTEDYEYVFAEVNHIDGMPGWVLRCGDYGMELARWVAATDKLDRGTHQCHHCGAHINYFAILKHTPTGDAIVVGETCLDGRFELASDDFHRLRKAAELDRKKMRIKKLRAAFITANPDLAFMDDQEQKTGNDFIDDVARRFRRYGELSEKQIAAVRRAVVRDAKWRERAAKEPQPVRIPQTGKHTVIAGTVISVRWDEDDYWGGSKLKALVGCPHDGGLFKIWTTVPSKVADVDKGDRLSLRGNVERSEDDESFGFMKRPYLVAHTTESEVDVPCATPLQHLFWSCECDHPAPTAEPAPEATEEDLMPPCGNRLDHSTMDCDCPDEDHQ